tara:strand:+ start:2592 stop:3086 length:495 start_codon:yes stop_codon:yes gene_type:complete
MKKIIYLILSIFLLISVIGCTGYEPIFSSSKLSIKIVEHSIEGDKKLGGKIYSQLNRYFNSPNNNSDTKKVIILIDTKKDITPTVKNSAGKIIEYRVQIKTKLFMEDFKSNKELINYTINLSSSYKVQDQYFETKKIEAKTIDELLNKIYQDLLIKISETVLSS